MTMWTFDIERDIAGRFVCLVGHQDREGAVIVTDVYDLDVIPHAKLAAEERTAFLAVHRGLVDAMVLDHAQAEDERIRELRASR
jgi:hypothetical protein